MEFRFRAELWEWDARAGAWHFLTLPFEVAEEIQAVSEPSGRGFGAVRVSVTIGKTRWGTSIFPESSGSFVLPVKKAVRLAEGIAAGDEVEVRLRIDAP